jgi:hypothetical protein
MSVLRDKTTVTVQFRGALEQIAILLLTEASKHWPTLATEFETPLAPMTGATLAQRVVFVPICARALDYSRECCASYRRPKSVTLGSIATKLRCSRSIIIVVYPPGWRGRIFYCLIRCSPLIAAQRQLQRF